MFEKGDYVIYGNNGICRVQDITTLSISGIDKNRKYYLLKPVYSSGSTVYTPVDTAETLLRPALSREEADSLIRSIPDIPLIPIADEKTLDKTIYLRKEKRTMKGYKVTALDSRYFSLAESSLYGELAIALDKPREEVKSYIASCIDSLPARS